MATANNSTGALAVDDYNGSDPFSSNPSQDPHRHRYAAFDNSQFSMYSTGTPAQTRKALQAHLSETTRRLQETSQLGNSLVEQRKELEERLREVEKQQEDNEIGPELRQKLAELEKEFNEVGRETARVFLPRSRVPSGETSDATAGASVFSSESLHSPSKISVPSRKQRNQQPTRINDVALATEISTSLLSQVKELQAALLEKDDALKAANLDRSHYEIEVEGLTQRLRTIDESESRLKDVNWNLETQLRELEAASKDSADKEQRLTQNLSLARTEKSSLEREFEELKQHYAKLNEEHTAYSKHHETEISSLRRNVSSGETERGALQRKIDDLASQNQELAKAVAYRMRADDHIADDDTSPDDGGDDREALTPDHSPPPSPSKATPRHGQLESETLKHSLHHAHRMIQNLKNNIHREKTEKIELKRMLQDARDELESRRDTGTNGLGSASKRRKQNEKDVFKKPARPDRLGAVRSVNQEILDDEDWEEHDAEQTPSRRAKFQDFLPGAFHGASSGFSSAHETGNEGFETATENSEAFETAHERDDTTTETDAFQTGAETLDGDSSDDLTETEADPDVHRSQRPAPLASRDSYESTASTSGDDLDDLDLRTPIQTQHPRYRLKIRQGGFRRSTRSSAEVVNTPPATKDSPSSLVSNSNNGTPIQGRSLFAELGNLSGESEDGSVADGTPSRSSLLSPESSPELVRRSPLGRSPLREVSPPKFDVVDSSTMTEPLIAKAIPLGLSSISTATTEPLSPIFPPLQLSRVSTQTTEPQEPSVDLPARVAELELAHKESQAALTEAQSRHQSASSRLAELEAALGTAESEKNNHLLLISDLESGHRQTKEALEEAQLEHQNTRTKLQELESVLQAAESEKSEYKVLIANLESSQRETDKALEQAQSDHQDSKAKLAEFEKALVSSQSENSRHKQLIANLESGHRESEEALDRARLEHQNSKSELEALIASLESSHRGSKEALESAQLEHANSKSQLEEMIANLESGNRESKDALEKALMEHQSTRARLEEIERKLEAAESEKSKNAVTIGELDSAHRQSKEALESAASEHQTTKNRLEGIEKALQAAETEKGDNAMLLSKIAELEAAHSQSRQDLEKALSAAQSEKSNNALLATNVAELEAAHAESKQALENAVQASKSVQDNNALLTAKIGELEAAHAESKQALDDALQASKSGKDNNALLAAKIADLETSHTESKQTLKKALEAIESEKGSNALLRAKIVELQAAHSESKEALDRALQASESQKGNNAALMAQLAELETAHGESKRSLDQALSDHVNTQSRLGAAEEALKAAELDRTDTAALTASRIAELQSAHGESKEALQRSFADLEDLRTKLNSAEDSLKAAAESEKGNIATLSARIADLEAAHVLSKEALENALSQHEETKTRLSVAEEALRAAEAAIPPKSAAPQLSAITMQQTEPVEPPKRPASRVSALVSQEITPESPTIPSFLPSPTTRALESTTVPMSFSDLLFQENEPQIPSRPTTAHRTPLTSFPADMRAPTVDGSTQTMVSSQTIDSLLLLRNQQRPSTAVRVASPPGSPKRTPLIVGAAESDKTPRRPGSSGSMRSRAAPPPPLPPGHREMIAAAAQKAPLTPTTPAHPPGSMGPPSMPASAYKKRPTTPVRTNSGGVTSPASKNGTTPRPHYGTTRSGTASPISRRSSVSSFASEIDHRFNISRGGMAPPDLDPNTTDPRMIQAITQTMIGEFLWKYTRKAGREGMSDKRHRRFFWVHPYTRTLYWSEQDPSTAGRAQLKAKSVAIESVQVVTDDNPFPPGLHRKSLVVITPGRTIKFTATTGQRHETWFNALSYLLMRTGEDHDEQKATTEEIKEFNPAYNRSSSRQTVRSQASRVSHVTQQTTSPSKQYPTLTPRQSSQRATSPVPPHGSMSGRLSSLSGVFRPGSALRGSFSSRRSRISAQEPVVHTPSEPRDSAEDLRRVIEQQERDADRFDLENVRACCDGKHDVGSLTHRHGHGSHSNRPSIVGSMSSRTHSRTASHGPDSHVHHEHEQETATAGAGS